jgi:hypothetical protein
MSKLSEHVASVLVQVEVFEKLESGELSGRPVTPDRLAEFGIKPIEKILVKGFDEFECLKKLSEKLNNLRT